MKQENKTKRPPQNYYRANESKIYGVNTCLAVFKSRPTDIVKVYLVEKKLRIFSDLVRWCVKNKKGYDVVDDVALEKLTESTHHEGVCLIVKSVKQETMESIFQSLGQKERQCLLYLDGVQNPHNVGNILRVCAHFGVKHILMGDAGFATLPASTRRVSEGGAEAVTVIHLRQPASDLLRLTKKGFVIYGTSSHCSQSIFKEKLAPRSLFVIGSEVEGMSPAIQRLCDVNLLIPGTGAVESLNVASACAVCVAEYFRSKV